MWTRFMDMHSGGGQKEPYAYIYIEAPEEEAVSVFFARFGHSPDCVTCTCCGEDYSISTEETLQKITAYDRGCDWDKDSREYVERPRAGYRTLKTYLELPNSLFIFAGEIEEHERCHDVPKQGYVWVD